MFAAPGAVALKNPLNLVAGDAVGPSKGAAR